MGIKTDYLKDCLTNKTITVNELIDLKNNLVTSDKIDENIDEKIKKIEDDFNKFKTDMRKDIDNKFSNLEENIDEKIEKMNEKIIKIEDFIKKHITIIDGFKYYKTQKIERNKYSLISKIIFKNNFYVTIDYVIPSDEEEEIFIFPSRVNYYNDKDKLLALEIVIVENSSIAGTETQILSNFLDEI